MADKTTYFEKAVIDFFLRPGAAAPTRPTSVLVELLTAITDAEAGTVTIVAYTGYAAQAAGFAASANNAGAERTSNAGVVEFPAVADGARTIVGYSVRDHLNNHLLVKTLTGGAVTYQIGDIPRINIGGLTHDEA